MNVGSHVVILFVKINVFFICLHHDGLNTVHIASRKYAIQMAETICSPSCNLKLVEILIVTSDRVISNSKAYHNTITLSHTGMGRSVMFDVGRCASWTKN